MDFVHFVQISSTFRFFRIDFVQILCRFRPHSFATDGFRPFRWDFVHISFICKSFGVDFVHSVHISSTLKSFRKDFVHISFHILIMHVFWISLISFRFRPHVGHTYHFVSISSIVSRFCSHFVDIQIISYGFRPFRLDFVRISFICKSFRMDFVHFVQISSTFRSTF